MPRAALTRFAWLSIGAAVVTIAAKTIAWRVTGSVGLLSDAAESTVNLVAAIMALLMLTVAARPPDTGHHFGHDKAEYFSAAVEGVLIFVAAVVIVVSAVERLVNPQELQSLSTGVIISAGASVVNAVVGTVLIRAGRRHRSVTLVADGKHLWTDVATSLGVVVAIALVLLTGWAILDPLIAIAVGVNIILTGVKLVRESVRGLMDATLPEAENRVIAAILAEYTTADVSFHGLRTRLAASQRFAQFDILVPGAWSVSRSHDLIEEVQSAIREALPDTHVQVHLEPKEDPRAYGDYQVEVPIPPAPDAAGRGHSA